MLELRECSLCGLEFHGPLKPEEREAFTDTAVFDVECEGWRNTRTMLGEANWMNKQEMEVSRG
jgi:hypothetical protein